MLPGWKLTLTRFGLRGPALLGLNQVPCFREHLLLVRIRQRVKRLLVGHPLHSVVLSPYLRIRLISLKEEEVNSLIVGFRTEPELVLDSAELAMQFHPADTSLLPYLSHS